MTGERKLRPWKGKLAAVNTYSNLMRWRPTIEIITRIRQEMRQDNIPISSFTATLDSLLQEFPGRFNDFNRILTALRLVASPHPMETESAPLDIQVELVELKNDEQHLKKLQEKRDLIEAWKLVVEYPKLR